MSLLLRLLLAALALLAGCGGGGAPRGCEAPPQAPESGRVVVLGIDGLEASMVDRLVARGELPAFARLLREGARVRLHVEGALSSPIIWTTVASGYPAEAHGIGGWTDVEGRPYTADRVRVRRTWDLASAAGRPVLVLGWLVTWPAREVRGALVTERLFWTYTLDRNPALPEARPDPLSEGMTWPPELAPRALRWQPDGAGLADAPIAYQLDEIGLTAHPAVRDEAIVRAFEHLWPELRPDVAHVYLATLDQVSHVYWPFADPHARRLMRRDPEARHRAAQEDIARFPDRRPPPYSDAPIRPEQIDEGARWVPDAYRFVDGLVGRVLDRVAAAPGTTLLVLGDHGFQVSRVRPTIRGGHRPETLLLLWGARVRPGARGEGTQLDVAPTVHALAGLPVADDMPGRVLDEVVDVSPPERVPTLRLDDAGDLPPLPDIDEERMMRDLRALGYIDAEGRPLPGAAR